MNSTSYPTLNSDEQIIITDEPLNEKSYRFMADPRLITNGVVKSRKKTSLKEFSLIKQLRPEVKAGFKVWLKGNEFHFDDEWEKLFYEYNHRR